MSARARIWLFLAAAAIFGALYLAGLSGLPPFGRYPGPYGDLVNAITVPERRITNAVSAVNFDVRALDTLGEESILFASVVGVVLLFRKLKDEEEEHQEDEAPERSVPAGSEATRLLALGLVGPLVLFGLYVVAHGHLTPGGGFQGGVVLATAPLLVYLAGGFEDFTRISSHALVEISEGLGAAAYVLIGLSGMAVGAAFLQNFLPLGSKGNVFSGGAVLLINASVGLEVAAGFVLLLTAFLEQTLKRRAAGHS